MLSSKKNLGERIAGADFRDAKKKASAEISKIWQAKKKKKKAKAHAQEVNKQKTPDKSRK